LAKDLGRIDDAWMTCANKLYYLAVPPNYYKKILMNLEKSGLTEPCSPEEGWTRVIVEKPFGKDLKNANELDSLLGRLFKEEQIYRIDHYLGKEMLLNILAFRFSNNIFEQSWNNKYIDSIAIKLLETAGVEDRGAFYDGVGTLRDVGQNHLVQMLALVTMENPGSFVSGTIRKKREDLLQTLVNPNLEDIKASTFRAQYTGYDKIEGVEKGSKTETYFKAKMYLDHPRWEGIPITLEAGKGMGEQVKEIVVRFKHPSPCLCPPGGPHDYHNKVIFAVEPKEEITFRLWSKKPGYKLAVEKRSFNLPYREKSKTSQYTEEYEKLLLDIFMGDQTLFVSTSEMQAMWKFTDPIVSAWQNGAVPLEKYSKGAKEVRKAALLDLATRDTKNISSKKEVGIVGLGKMGGNMARQLVEKGWMVFGYNRTSDITRDLEKEMVNGVYSFGDFVDKMTRPRTILVSVPAGEAVDEMMAKLVDVLEKGDIVVDIGNSFYTESKKHSKQVAKKGIEFVDVGISGGPGGARYGACLMVGGKKENYDYLLPLFIDLSVVEGYEFFEGPGAGHFVKMVHNAIEYGMMQSIAEGFDLMRRMEYKLHLKKVARIYNHGSVIESRLVGWMGEAYSMFGEDLNKISGKAGAGGSSGGAIGKSRSEAAWTLEIADKLGISMPSIKDALKNRERSQKKPSYQGKIINSLRNRFGGHGVKEIN
jgi:glucose-6-phosphate 1-dehydrogenase